jgi:hypothetical protein
MIFTADLETLSEHHADGAFSVASNDLGALTLCLLANGPASAVDVVGYVDSFYTEQTGNSFDIDPSAAKRQFKKALDYELIEKQKRKFALTTLGVGAACYAGTLMQAAHENEVQPSWVFGQSKKINPNAQHTQRFEGPLSRAILLVVLNEMSDGEKAVRSDDIYKHPVITQLGLENTTIEKYLRAFELRHIVTAERTLKDPTSPATVNAFSLTPGYDTFAASLSESMTSGIFLPQFTRLRSNKMRQAASAVENPTIVLSALQRYAAQEPYRRHIPQTEIKGIIEAILSESGSITPNALNAYFGNRYTPEHASRILSDLGYSS